MTTPTSRLDIEGLVKAAGAATAGEWIPGHLCQDDHPCNCAYVLSESYMGSICTVQSQDSSEDNAHNPPSTEAKANQRYIALANPPTILALAAQRAALLEALRSVSAARHIVETVRTAPGAHTLIMSDGSRVSGEVADVVIALIGALKTAVGVSDAAIALAEGVEP